MSNIKDNKTKKINVAVIFGGRSGEHEVSLVSAEAVINNLDKSKYNIIQIGITKGGQWIAGPEALQFLKTGTGSNYRKEIITPDTLDNVINGKKIDVVFPVLHGTYGEDGTMQGLLELANVAYVGAGVLGSAVAMDKVTQKILCGAENIVVPDWVWLSKQEWLWTKQNKLVFQKWLVGIEKRIGYPIFVKPSNMGSSVGISKAHNRRELIEAINLASKYDRRILIEQGIEGALDMEVAVLGNEKPEASTVGQIISSNEFYDYNAKYIDGKSQAIVPAKLPLATAEKIKEMALAAYKLLDAAGMGRADFLVRQKGGKWEIFFNELNTIPGFTAISMYPKLWQASGVACGKLLDILISLARERFNEKKQLLTSYRPKKQWYK